MIAAPLTLEFHALGTSKLEALRADVRAGLTSLPKELPPRWFYDDAGSELFERITELPEYYQTRAETEILAACSQQIAQRFEPHALVELGSGSSTKTRLLLDAARRAGHLEWFVPFDVSDTIVRESSLRLLEDYPGLAIHAIIGDFFEHLDRIPRFGRQLLVLLGGTIGNFFPDQRQAFLLAVSRLMRPQDAFLVGLDLVKDAATLVAAYDDAQGVTARFNLNVLRVLNRELGADFDLARFTHVARYDAAEHRIEMHLRSLSAQTVHIRGANLAASFAAGELLRTEISTKFTRADIEADFAIAGLKLSGWYTDRLQRFALALAVLA
ncbi:MAG: L-histidine N(alpha)-methyltransferase [Chloroflexota bacterium]